MVLEVDLSQNLLPPGYPVVTPRHVALLLATWMLARIAEVVHDLLEATQRSEAKGAAASLPVQQGEPTLKAGSSVSKQPYSYGGVHAWTPLEARNFKVRRARATIRSLSHCGDTVAMAARRHYPHGSSRHPRPRPPGALRPQLPQVRQEGAEWRGARRRGGDRHL